MMASSGSDNGNFDDKARQYWAAWGDAMRHGQAGAAAQQPPPTSGSDAPQDWRKAVDWWSQLLPTQAAPQAQEAIDRFRTQAGDWFGTMQQVAAQFAGRDTSANEVADAWRQAVQGQGEQLMQWTLGSLRGGSPGGFDPWLQDAAQALQKWREENAPWLDMPAFGLNRNHQSRLQKLARAQQEFQAQSEAYGEQLKAAIEQAFARFASKLSEHESSGSQLTSARALFDLWIEAAEESYADVALSEQFGKVYGGFANAHMRLRAALQEEVEQLSERFGMPTRSEMDAAHRRIAELERLVRRMLRNAASPASKPAASAQPAPETPAAGKRASSAGASAVARPAGAARAVKQGASKKAPVDKTATKKAAPKKTPAVAKSTKTTSPKRHGGATSSPEPAARKRAAAKKRGAQA
ncbi:class III poly(R)-hydroxyalkanoic acid synthase subunit PhaE [Xanthomonas citri pv. fuscans CFBP 6996]|uniref:class III poly(R)-hydroxyalkanoic acid synthase subunit PhaE n=1 Tax=Xanthomonas TaxID=338 RepID=UPI000C1972AE|nr:class III poly(R)-hydroxyalkanoic acid synthase subunit PhaE [Xanthomonas citri]ATS51737.1 class III poly(R)-hydroxyalkanoic acid synthase subunit PhaE [Xanthomonas citri pv. phaseoli var. fuscans]ATS57459.1 class III poly(R)-hydroxyalkanoic acid synthase subunit PhaE [Xanthomonas citri pv. phaseoli var. fuscans]ATS58536.1 class III poly(R)-hydroxyalkanoic acid synthase subunit PhaE [Xanthomonas citri pv. phaseoli var. fuscans]PTY32380.1 class III poly(R)-hydroxyalkanoic acid synthase subuni